MFQDFSEESRCVIVRSKREADLAGSTAINAEHLLLGLLRESGNLLERLGYGRDRAEMVRLKISDLIPQAPMNNAPHDLPLGDTGLRVVNLSREEALKLGDHLIDPGHILLALARTDAAAVQAAFAESGLAYGEMSSRLSESRKR